MGKVQKVNYCTSFIFGNTPMFHQLYPVSFGHKINFPLLFYTFSSVYSATYFVSNATCCLGVI
jgi:hypothetical protein